MEGGNKQNPVSLARSWDNAGNQAFVPEHYAFSEERAQVGYIADNPVGQLISAVDGAAFVSVVPFVWTARRADGGLRLAGHMAARNPQEAHVASAREGIAHFISPGAYISPRWFRKNNTAATFSYVSLQVRGRLVPVKDPDETRLILARTVDHMEALTSRHDKTDPWNMGTLSAEQMERYIPMVRAFYMEVRSVEGIARLNQEKERADMEGIIEGLGGQPSSGARHIAALMAQNLELMEG